MLRLGPPPDETNPIFVHFRNHYSISVGVRNISVTTALENTLRPLSAPMISTNSGLMISLFLFLVLLGF